MIEAQQKQSFETLAAADRTPEELTEIARAARAGNAEAREQLAAAFVRAGFAAPALIAPYYDAAALGWFSEAVSGPSIAVVEGDIAPISAALWSDFWDLIDARGDSVDAGDITARTAAISAHLGDGYREMIARVCAAYPGVLTAAAQGFPPRFVLEDLNRCPDGSLGNVLYRMIVDNQFDLEVLDRDALQLAALQPPLDYLNARILQSHDLWHIVAGYETTKLHEVAISAFQLAQFGHSYSAMFLAIVSSSAVFRPEAAFDLLVELILSAWVHGRRTPPMLGIVWEDVWHLPLSEVRRQYGIEPYVSPCPPDLAEQLEAAAG